MRFNAGVGGQGSGAENAKVAAARWVPKYQAAAARATRSPAKTDNQFWGRAAELQEDVEQALTLPPNRRSIKP